MHEALIAAVAELATAPDPTSTPDALTTVQVPKMRKLARSLDLSVVHCKRNRNGLPKLRVQIPRPRLFHVTIRIL